MRSFWDFVQPLPHQASTSPKTNDTPERNVCNTVCFKVNDLQMKKDSCKDDASNPKSAACFILLCTCGSVPQHA
eukprot:1162067-Pelagomonas_calceolata.AAC.7